MKYAYLDKYNRLHINPSKATALEYSINGKVVETDFPEVQGSPLKSGAPVVRRGGAEIDYSSCEYYSVKSLEEAEACGNAAIVELYKSVM